MDVLVVGYLDAVDQPLDECAVLLAAAERGLGGCMIGNYNADSVKKQIKAVRHVLFKII